ncbi:MAG TPA: amidohydrolase [Candidatus Polarisedimenticolia bacterium]|nr:amidohydrolase [Candidatus Polarisedimenticolia bacterium]
MTGRLEESGHPIERNVLRHAPGGVVPHDRQHVPPPGARILARGRALPGRRPGGRGPAVLRLLAGALAAAALIPALLACGGAPANPADLVLVGGRVYTVESDHPWAQAVAVRGDRILKVGKDEEIRALVGPKTRVIDLKGRLLLPGLIDGHTHFLDGSLGLEQVDLTGATTLPEIQDRIRRYATEHPDEPWILGFGWLYSTFPGGLPNHRQLDAVESRRPVFLYSYDGHSAWTNGAALKAAEITARTPQLAKNRGEVVKDPKTGEPTGALKEGATGLVERVLPKPSREKKIGALEKGLRLAASLGLTSVQNCSGGQDEIDLYDELNKEGRLTLRTSTAFVMPDSPADLTDAYVARIVAARDAHQGNRFVRAGTAKFFADGVIESNTAAMLAPYANDPSTKGTPHYDARQLDAMVLRIDAADLQIYIHAIGDAGVRMSLDALQAALRAHPGKRRRHRLEHIETIDATDIPRFGHLGILAGMQPYHAYPEPNLESVWARNIGPERVERAFAWNSIASAGGRLVFGSDWPVVTLDPMVGIRNAVLRQNTDGLPKEGWVPQQRVTLEQAVAAYTINGAFASFEEDLKGSIKEGKLADLVVLSQDLFTVPPEKIHETKALLTLVGGKEVYRDAALQIKTP